MPRPATDPPEGTGALVAEEPQARDSGTAREATDRLVSQLREQANSLKGQAGDKLRGFADDGKDRTTNLLDDISAVIEDAANSIEQRLGADYGDYAHRAADAVSSFSGRMRQKSVDDRVDDGRQIVRKSPAVAIAAAAVVGFALMRLVRTGLDEDGARRRRSDADRS
jgi:hypothetical protein